MWFRALATAVLAVLALAGTAARAGDPPRNAQDPNAGFLEFLGSVDRLSEVNPDYLSQADPPRAGQPPGPVRPVQTPPPPQPLPAPGPNPPGVKNNG
jgi:hypothetical protein